MNKNHLRLFKFSKYLLDTIPFYIEKIEITKNELCLHTKANRIKDLIFYLKNHSNCKYQQLVDICGVDYPGRKDRFEIIYNLLSVTFNTRIRIKVKASETSSVESVSRVYNSALWLEREVWDMYGVFFANHKDLRRILTDYGFEGYPLRKDFPQIGFVEVRYDDTSKYVLYEPVELAQEYRIFNFLSPWLQVK